MSRRGIAVVEKYGTAYMSELGKKGGRALVEKYGDGYMQQIARNSRNGGQAVVAKYGKAHMAKIGAMAGKAKFRDKYHGDVIIPRNEPSIDATCDDCSAGPESLYLERNGDIEPTQRFVQVGNHVYHLHWDGSKHQCSLWRE